MSRRDAPPVHLLLLGQAPVAGGGFSASKRSLVVACGRALSAEQLRDRATEERALVSCKDCRAIVGSLERAKQRGEP